MKYLKKYSLFESVDPTTKSIINDCLVDLEDDGFSYECDFRDRDTFSLEIMKFNKSSDVFSFDEIKSSLNQLISQLDNKELNSIEYHLKGGIIYDNENTWKKISMDPTEGEILGNKLLCIKKDEVDISNIKCIDFIKLYFDY